MYTAEGKIWRGSDVPGANATSMPQRGRPLKWSNEPIPHMAIAAEGRRSPASAGETLCCPTATLPPRTSGNSAAKGRVLADRGACRAASSMKINTLGQQKQQLVLAKIRHFSSL